MTHCLLCGRELGDVNVDEHHLIPKSRKGKETIRLHRVCHRKIHATYTEKELEQYYNTIHQILENEEIQKFVKWVAKKPAEYYDCSDETNQRYRKRRR